jgi:proline dehydrogenase
VSLKLTALGLDIDPALCRENMRSVLKAASKNGVRVTIDMEDHSYTQRTLDTLYALMREDGYENVQAVIQAYLYRTDEDIEKLAADGIEIRLCKGAYKEPSTVAYPAKSDVDAAYVRQMKVLLDAARDNRGYPMLATHDDKIIAQARQYITVNDIPRERFEFQMLYGIRTALQHELIREGYRLRVYVPYGQNWYPYFMRRLAERPANLWFFASNLLRN